MPRRGLSRHDCLAQPDQTHAQLHPNPCRVSFALSIFSRQSFSNGIFRFIQGIKDELIIWKKRKKVPNQLN